MAKEASKQYVRPTDTYITKNASTFSYSDDPDYYKGLKIDQGDLKAARQAAAGQDAAQGLAIGSSVGGAIGTIAYPGVGTAVGGVVGAGLGAGIGAIAGSLRGQKQEIKRQTEEYEAEQRKKKAESDARFDTAAYAANSGTPAPTGPSVESMGTPTASASDAWRKQVYG